MSAGTGVYHSEFNYNPGLELKLFQIWIFPNKKNVEPRYDQISIREVAQENTFFQILSPNGDDQGVWIHQDAWFHLGHFDKGMSDNYKLKKKGNGVYLFVIEGEVGVEGQHLEKRDGFGIWEVDEFHVLAKTDARVLLMEVPMK